MLYILWMKAGEGNTWIGSETTLVGGGREGGKWTKGRAANNEKLFGQLTRDNSLKGAS